MQSPWQRSRFYEKPISKRKFFKQDYKQRRYDEEENQESDDEYVTEFRQRKKPQKRIVYVDEMMEMTNNLNQKQNQKLLKKK